MLTVHIPMLLIKGRCIRCKWYSHWCFYVYFVDGTATDTAKTPTAIGINDDPVAVNDTDAVNEDATITKTGSEDDVLNDDTDADDSSSLTVTQIKKDGGSNSAVSSGSTYNSSGTLTGPCIRL